MREIKKECTDCVCNGCEYAESCRSNLCDRCERASEGRYPITYDLHKSVKQQSREECTMYKLYQHYSFQKELQNPKLEFLHE